MDVWIFLIWECDFCYCYHHRGHGGHHPGGHQGRRKRSQHHKQATSWGHFPSPFWDQLLFWRFKSFFCNLPSIWYQLSTSHLSILLLHWYIFLIIWPWNPLRFKALCFWSLFTEYHIPKDDLTAGFFWSPWVKWWSRALGVSFATSAAPWRSLCTTRENFSNHFCRWSASPVIKWSADETFGWTNESRYYHGRSVGIIPIFKCRQELGPAWILQC